MASGLSPEIGDTEAQVEVRKTARALWDEALQIGPDQAEASFLSLGGHSLSALKLVSTVREALSREVSVGAVLSAENGEAFADALVASETYAPPQPSSRRADLAPASAVQRRFWIDGRMKELGSVNSLGFAWRLSGELNAEALRDALAAIFVRHSALRTVFIEKNGELFQSWPALAHLPFHFDDLRGREDAEDCCRVILAQERASPFDLGAGGLARARLLRLDTVEHIVALNLHHIIGDGWSLGLLQRELSDAYNALTAGQSWRPGPAPQFSDYISWQECWLTPQRLARQAEHWKHALAGAPLELRLPTDFPRSVQPDFSGATAPFFVSESTTADLKALALSEGVTLFNVLLAGWAFVLHRLCGDEDVVIGMPVANRQNSAFAQTVGLFANTVALRIGFHDAPTLRTLLRRARNASVSAQENADIPFDMVVKALNPPRSAARAPIFQTMINLRNVEADLVLDGLSVQHVPLMMSFSEAELGLDAAESDGKLLGLISYRTALFSRATVLEIREQLVRCLALFSAQARI